MLGRFWVDDWWMGGLLVDSLGGSSSGCKRCLILIGFIAKVVVELRTRWALNVEVNSRGLFLPEHEGG
jgi:hypothetical protein